MNKLIEQLNYFVYDSEASYFDLNKGEAKEILKIINNYNNVYDNGELLLGTKKDILEYQNKMIQQELIDKEDYKEIIEFLKEQEEDTIVCINYDNGMGLSFDIWTKKDIVKVGK